MKISKRQLKTIIKEEKQKLREQSQSSGERARGLYADDSMAKQAESILLNLYDVMTEAMQEDGFEIEEAEDMAAEGLLAIVNNVLRGVGHLNAELSLKGDAGASGWDR